MLALLADACHTDTLSKESGLHTHTHRTLKHDKEHNHDNGQ